MLKKQFRIQRLNHSIGAGVAALLFCFTVQAGEVQMSDLSDFSPSAYGITAGVPLDLWTQSDKKLIYKLLDKIAIQSLKQSERVRLSDLLSRDTGRFMWTDVQQSDDFLVKRMHTLFQVGDFQTVERVIQSLPARRRSDALAAVLADVYLMQKNGAAVLRVLEENPNLPNASQKRISALLLQDDLAGAGLQYELYRENNVSVSDYARVGDAVFRDRPLTEKEKVSLTPELLPLWLAAGQKVIEKTGWIQAGLKTLKPDMILSEEKTKSPDVKQNFTSSELSDIADLTVQSMDMYPMDMYRALGQAATEKRRAEAVLWGILLLSESDFYRPEITQIMDEMMEASVPVPIE